MSGPEQCALTIALNYNIQALAHASPERAILWAGSSCWQRLGHSATLSPHHCSHDCRPAAAGPADPGACDKRGGTGALERQLSPRQASSWALGRPAHLGAAAPAGRSVTAPASWLASEEGRRGPRGRLGAGSRLSLASAEPECTVGCSVIAGLGASMQVIARVCARWMPVLGLCAPHAAR